MTDLERAKKRYNSWKQRGEGRAYLAMLFSMCEGICPVCGVQMFLAYGDELNGLPKNRKATFDHIEPIKFTKRHEKTNLMICCWKCNTNDGGNRTLWNATLRAGSTVPLNPSPRADRAFVTQGLPKAKTRPNKLIDY